MNNAMQPVPEGHPLMVAWRQHQKSPEYENTLKWAKFMEHTEGSLWAVFSAGFHAGAAAVIAAAEANRSVEDSA